MKHTQGARKALVKQKLIVAAVASTLAGSALAIEFETDSGWRGTLNTTVSASASWRAEGPDKALVWPENYAVLKGDTVPTAAANQAAFIARANALGATGGALSDDGNLNYDKGDRYQTLFKFVSELSMTKGQTGGLMRLKGWYDQSLNDENVLWGNGTTGYGYQRTSRELSDSGLAPLAKFDGLYLLDAYAYTSFDLGELPLQVRAGRQAVNWGESVFIQGLNQLTPLDLIALRKAGTEIKEALLPVWSLYGNLGLPGGASLEAYYQLKWEPSVIDSCGTFLAPTDVAITTGNSPCGGTPLARAGQSDLFNYSTAAAMQAAGQLPKIGTTKGEDAKDGGQWGIALRFPVDAIDTEFGLYAMNIHSRTPIISGISGGGVTTPGAAVPGISSPNPAAWRNFNTAVGLYGAAVGAGTGVNTAGMNALLGTGTALGTGLAYGQASALPADQAALVTQCAVADIGAGGVAGTAGARCTAALTAAATPATGLAASLGYLVPTVAINQAKSFWEYAENQKIVGISASTTIAGVSVGVELSHQMDIPAQLNGNDMLGALVGRGPAVPLTLGADGLPLAAGTVVHAFKLFDKTQLQLNGVASLPSMLGASAGLAIGEVGFQWNNVPENNGTNLRYGRNFIFGTGAFTQAGVTATNTCSAAAPVYNRQADGCKNDGYIDDFAWGYRVRMSLDYNGIFDTSWNFTPTVFWAHDVDGYSLDSQFNEGRKVLSLSGRFSLNKVHNIDLNYTTYGNSADYDAFRDRDNYSVAYSYTF
ncbi:MAG: DUF1302 domain-containing protein [Rhodocyclaceae bacterium]|nr:DUF1302 domain-containing protein [Rhodocyclaceae bacterium]